MQRDSSSSSDTLTQWLDSVASGGATMSQRQVAWAEAHGGLEQLVAAARERGIHLVRLTDDKGKELIAGSQKPFTTLC